MLGVLNNEFPNITKVPSTIYVEQRKTLLGYFIC